MKAERKRRESILQAKGEKASKILEAEGVQAVRHSEGRRRSDVLLKFRNFRCRAL